MTPDHELLAHYAARRDEAAFAELVRRHVDLVYSVVLRQAAGDAPLAQDVTQTVFLDLVRKAGELSRHATLAGWLHTSARFAASKAVRGEQRRRHHEQEASAMQETTTAAVNWEQLRPLLDEGVGQLDEPDRDAIVLRFFEGKSHREVGTLLGLNENSANKRIERALEKLRAYFARRGVTASSVALAAAISENSVQAAPVGLAANVAGVAVAGKGAGVGTGAGVAAEGVFLKILLMCTKNKILLAGVIVLIIATTWIFYLHSPQETAAVAEAKPPGSTMVKAEVVAPTLPQVAAPMTSPAIKPVTVPQPIVGDPAHNATPAELNAAIDNVATLLQASDFVGVFEYGPPADLAEIPPEQKAEMEQRIRQAMAIPLMQQMMQGLSQLVQDLKNQTPEINATGDQATYQMTLAPNMLPPGTNVPASMPMVFVKIDGKWHLSGHTIDAIDEYFLEK